MKLTKRLEVNYDLCPNCACVADVGTDHGYLAAALVKRGKADKVIAIDVHSGPLESAKKFICEQGLENKVECRLGDGLSVSRKGELNGAIMGGMGGFLICDIIAAAPEKLDFYVLQPQNGQRELRQYLINEKYAITNERLVKDMGKYYIAFLARKIGTFEEKLSYGGKSCNEYYTNLPLEAVQWTIGGLLSIEKPELWSDYINYLIKQRTKICAALKNSQNSEKIGELQEEIKQLEKLK